MIINYSSYSWDKILDSTSLIHASNRKSFPIYCSLRLFRLRAGNNSLYTIGILFPLLFGKIKIHTKIQYNPL